jgi:hypothetical protein
MSWARRVVEPPILALGSGAALLASRVLPGEHHWGFAAWFLMAATVARAAEAYRHSEDPVDVLSAGTPQNGAPRAAEPSVASPDTPSWTGTGWPSPS